ncbi:MAG: transcription-repair coupling factor [Gammaproteobacteria bacterium]|nr:transcription-repair coupling factor [Gammaproteobacteria bacterium]
MDSRLAEQLPTEPGQRLVWDNVFGAAGGYLAAQAAAAHDSLVLIVANDAEDAVRWQDEMAFFSTGGEGGVVHFPDWETLPYDVFSPHPDIVSERLATLRSLARLRRGVLIVSVTALMQRLTPPEYVESQSFELVAGDVFDTHTERARLEAAGYTAVETVENRGEFAVRGSLMDIFPAGAGAPIRIDMLDDEIESLRLFDPDTQRTVERVPAIRMLPAKEFPLDDAAIARFRNRWHETFDVDVRTCSVYKDVSAGIPPGGIEYYLPLFFDGLATLFDYLPRGTLAMHRSNLGDAARHFQKDIESRYESLAYDIERPILPPDALFMAPDRLHERLRAYPRISLRERQRPGARRRSRTLPNLEANARLKQPAQSIIEFMAANRSARFLFTAETAGRREVLSEFLARAGIRAEGFPGLSDFLAGDAPCVIATAPLHQGLWADGLILVTESQIFGHRPTGERVSGARVVDPDQIVRDLSELSSGAPVVHLEHGIGRYLGLQTLSVDGYASEFLTLEYAGGDKLYVPVTSLHLITRYTGAGDDAAPLHRLGSDQWEKAKRRAAAKAVDVAAELLNIHARRAARESVPLAFERAEYERFAARFPFELTEDQARAIDAVVDDLASEKATDRLVCGDVGFGKTEVAMRAAFATVLAGKQVVVLVPTTLLAQQHLDTFTDRFADWPVQIEAVSRLRTDRETQAIRERMQSGRLDILIGTHKLLGPSFRFDDLGLVVIDEEHRFGVRQKERLKALRAEVDVITLTATPIPRTLNMAMSGIRDLSIIATPPARRLSIKTFIQEKRNHIVREAINRELMRGGQVFYVHNEVRTIERAAEQVAELAPAARIGIGHGQMAKRSLEQVMKDFHQRQLNVLVCTTIIENGIDIPNANTIVIDRADKFGLAQLHQLRGRVGRSHRQAYAYLLTPHPSAMTADSVKRLEAVQAAGDLGIGFALATRDLEIRGAGELLGEEQSGQIESIGFSLYMELLRRAVSAIQAGQVPNLDAPLEPVGQEVNLHCSTLIPEDYLPDVHTRLLMYKRIANAVTAADLEALQVEMIDRFGLLPVPLRQLFRVTELKLRLNRLGIVKFDLGERGGLVTVGENTIIDPSAVVALVRREGAAYRMDGASRLRVVKALPDLKDRFAFAEQLLEALAPAETFSGHLAAGG